MNLIYSCVFTNENYITLFKKLLTSYCRYNDTSNACYLVITSEDFREKIMSILSESGLEHYDIWTLDVCTNPSKDYNVYESTYTRYFLFNYPKLHKFEKILYLDCDILIVNNIDSLFSLELENKFYFVHEPMDRYNHCALFNDSEYENLDSECTFTTAIILFENTPINSSNLEKFYDFVKKLHMNYINPLPAYDQPVVNKVCIEEKIYDNVLLRNYCLNIMPTDGVEKINLIPKYTMCHFATNVGEHTSKLQRISTVQKVLNIPIDEKDKH